MPARIRALLDELIETGCPDRRDQLGEVRDELARLDIEARTAAAATANMAELYVELETALSMVVAQKQALEEAERARGASEAMLAHVLDALPDALVVLDGELRATTWNAAARRLFEAEVPDDFVTDHVAPVSRSVLRDVCQTQARHHVEIEVVTRTGRCFAADVTVTVAATPGGSYFSLTFRDRAQLDKAKEELRQAQKLEAIGRLAAGVAHEINTPVQFIGDSVTFLQESYGDVTRVIDALDDPPEKVKCVMEAVDLGYLGAEVPRAFARVEDGLSRVASIVRALKEFAHPDQAEKSYTDLNRALATTITISRPELKHVAHVETQFVDLPPVLCYAGQLNQVFLNLLVNAAHAIEDSGKFGEGDQGTIRITTSCTEDRVCVEIGDNGCGISDAIRDRIFEPFFTTKELGRGTGQGLALTHSVVTGHGGTITIDSTPGVGTTFAIWLPIAGADAVVAS